MRFLALALAFAVAACGFQAPQTDQSTVTVTLPPPKAPIGPGFSTPVAEQG
jgi:hypothetical protein